MSSPAHAVILDTDIGSDVDDAMALSVLLGHDDVDLLGVTTAYGDTLLRARLGRRYARLAGADIPTYAGLGTPLSRREVWWAGHEGTLHAELAAERIEPVGAVEYLTSAVRRRPGEIDIIAIAPLTNLAAAIRADESFARGVRGLWLMGGAFDSAEAEHNLVSDDEAARIVFDAGIPTVVCPLEVTRRVQIRADQLDRVRGAGPLGATLAADIDQWWRYWNEEWNVPHDPVNALVMARPDLFELSVPGRVVIGAGSEAGISRFVPDPAGTVRLVRGVNVAAVTAEIVACIERAGAAGARAGEYRASPADVG